MQGSGADGYARKLAIRSRNGKAGRLALAGVVALVLFGTGVQARDFQEASKQGFDLYKESRFEEALPLFEEALRLAEQELGADDPTIAVELNNVAETLRQLGRYEEALPYHLRSVALDERAAEGDEIGLATTLNNLGLTYRALGRFEDAERSYARSLKLFEATLGPNHPSSAKTAFNLGKLRQAQGEFEDALPLMERAVRVARESLGPDEPATASFAEGLDNLKREMATARASAAEAAPRVAASVTLPDTPKPAAADAPEEAETPKESDAPNEARAPVPEGGLAGSLNAEAEPNADSVEAKVAPPVAKPTAPGASGPFALHFASVRSPEQVGEEWQRLRQTHGLQDLPPRPPEAVQVEGDTFYRVLRGSFDDDAQAKAACADVTAKGAWCSVRKLF